MNETDSKLRIIQVGRELLNAKDYHETVIDEIANRAGVAKGTVFFHFKSKENLFREIMFSVVDDIVTMMRRANETHASGLQKLRQVYDEYINLCIKNQQLVISIQRELARGASGDSGGVTTLHREILDRFAPAGAVLREIASQMKTDGVLKEYGAGGEALISPMVMTFAGAVGAMVHLYRSSPDFDRLRDLLWGILMHGILRENVSQTILETERT